MKNTANMVYMIPNTKKRMNKLRNPRTCPEVCRIACFLRSFQQCVLQFSKIDAIKLWAVSPMLAWLGYPFHLSDGVLLSSDARCGDLRQAWWLHQQAGIHPEEERWHVGDVVPIPLGFHKVSLFASCQKYRTLIMQESIVHINIMQRRIQGI
jgi:hypothetical protein